MYNQVFIFISQQLYLINETQNEIENTKKDCFSLNLTINKEIGKLVRFQKLSQSQTDFKGSQRLGEMYFVAKPCGQIATIYFGLLS